MTASYSIDRINPFQFASSALFETHLAKYVHRGQLNVAIYWVESSARSRPRLLGKLFELYAHIGVTQRRHLEPQRY